MAKFLVYTDVDGNTAVVVPRTSLPGETEAKFLDRLAVIEVENGRVASPIQIVEGDPRPQNRTFRNAWTLNGDKIDHDMPKARSIHMDRIREARDEKLKSLDNDWMKATGQNKKAEAEAVEAKRQWLRDIPQTFDLNAATPEELEKLWPDFGE